MHTLGRSLPVVLSILLRLFRGVRLSVTMTSYLFLTFQSRPRLQGALAIAEALEDNGVVEHLELRDNDIGGKHLFSLGGR